MIFEFKVAPSFHSAYVIGILISFLKQKSIKYNHKKLNSTLFPNLTSCDSIIGSSKIKFEKNFLYLLSNHCVMVTSTVMSTSMASHHSVPSGNSLDSGGAPSGGGHSSGAPGNSSHLVTPSCNSSSVVVLSPSKMREEEKRLQMVSLHLNSAC